MSTFTTVPDSRHAAPLHADPSLRRERAARVVRLGTTLLSGLLLVGACSKGSSSSTAPADPGEPTTSPYVSGRITSLVPTTTSGGTIKVEAVPGNNTTGAKAVATVDNVTRVIGINGKTSDFRALALGQWVRLWYDGTILTTYPAQGFAGTVKIDSLAVSVIVN